MWSCRLCSCVLQMIKTEVDDTGVLKKPVTPKDVSEAIAKQLRINLAQELLIMTSPITSPGDWSVPLQVTYDGAAEGPAVLLKVQA